MLPSAKDFISKSDKKEDKDEDRRRLVSRLFNNWLQAFSIFSGILCKKFPEKSTGLFQHVAIILEAFNNVGGTTWYNYDKAFHQKLSVHPSLK